MVLCSHPILGPLFLRDATQYEAGLDRVTQTMAGVTAISLAAMRFRSGLQELWASDRYVLVGVDDPVLEEDRDRVLGYWAPDGGVYLYSDLSRQAVERLLGSDALGSISPQELHRQLDGLGYVASRAKDGYLKPVKVGKPGKKVSTRLLHLTREFLAND